ncbi:unnamed protein product [Miscanthus lutarioriparius]|uniref:Protein FAM32A-like n=1 Tax=Miscanthus lutarioriparius TaxID=422564 RepID=A0A811Q849_9POAL|nr:unnamed protein product [Miscanthus lutarioriparius]
MSFTGSAPQFESEHSNPNLNCLYSDPEMSEYQNVVGGRLKLKGKALDVKEAERRYMELKQKMAKVANKSHRDRIQDFNQYLANLSEHYDIPKVGPG